MNQALQKPKVLVLDEWLPFPCDTGKKIRTYNLIKNLSGTFDLIYLAYVNINMDDIKIKHLNNLGIKVEGVEDERKKKGTFWYWLIVLKNLFSKDPFAVYYHYTNKYNQKIKEVIEKCNPDLIHCEWTFYATYIKEIKNIPIVISAHNIEYQQWERFAKSADNPIKKIYGVLQAYKIKKFESNYYPKGKVCVVVSENDQRIINSYRTKAVVIENGVDLSFYQSPKLKEIKNNKHRLIYTASMDAFSNQDAVIYFISEIFPIINKKEKNVEFWIVGKNPSSKIIKYSKNNANIKVTGTVNDVRPLIASASISIVPLRIAGGTRLKILEAMAMGKPVVSTKIGCEGLRVKNGKNIIIADHPVEFAQAIIKLLNDEDLRLKIGKSGKELVCQFYDWKPISEKQGKIWYSLLREGSAKSGEKN